MKMDIWLLDHAILIMLVLFDGSGEMLTGWQYYLGAWWYHKPSGAWVQSNYANGTLVGIDVSYYQKILTGLL